ncbi:MAG: polyphosphate:AMP phosphotransferase [Betaproteobacteria bacterium RIFCSPLOWO2_02_64_14]|nr:MAG: polyphosphate:AMP phosphotransferase [Betaproteobacteria bacterium RIFCSPLOWO2_02_64_14]
MFESANLRHRVNKATYRREEAKLREALLNAQYDLKENSRFPVLILIAGVEGAGKGETVNLLNEWMDPRHIEVSGFAEPSDEENERPRMWRYWRALPPKGKIGIFFGAWHTQPIVDRVQGRIGTGKLDQHIADILRFEKMLTDEGVLLLKFWLHLSKAQQKKRLKALEKDPKTRWRVSKTDWELFKLYDRFGRVCEPFLRKTSTGEAPWLVVSGLDPEYRSLTVGKTLLAALRERLDEKKAKGLPDKNLPLLPSVDKVNVLRALELDQEMSKEVYAKQLEKWQGRLALALRQPRFKEISVVAVFEGNDAAGKGGAIRRVTSALDARRYKTISVAAPTEEERAQPYLWRFWRHIPRRGRFVIFDRSWYGRVLVERVEGFCTEADWMRAYTEINDFEQELVRNGIVVAKFWLATSKEEQYKRFKAREQVSFKRFKITAEDWRNRKKWEQYELAVCDMVDRTSTGIAPWTLVEANNKYHARVKVLTTLVHAVEGALEAAKKG